MQRLLGVDIGGVIKDSGYLDGEVPGAIDALARIQTHGGFDYLYLVSQTIVGSRWYVQRWLTQRDFWARTGIKKDSDVLFCNRWCDKALFAEELHLTHFIDDRFDVLNSMPPLVTHCFLFGGSHVGEGLPSDMIYVPDWDTLVPLLLRKAA